MHPIMFAGTGSDVGKSVIATAFCRIFLQDGYNPAPFKAQNMALNSYVTPDGLEIGRAQAVQAEAARVPCHVDMNPLLLKPQSDHTSQVVLLGRPMGNCHAYDYFRQGEGREELRRQVCQAFDRLAARHNPIVMEGAGSISEINLRDTDLVNLPMALHAKADVFLVADIDRGGVFASVYGSVMLLRPHERQRVKGILINKFRGDLRLFEQGAKILADLCGIPVVGIVPFFDDIHIEEEDSVALAYKSFRASRGKVNVAVVLLRHISNFTDFGTLERDPRVHLFYTNNTDELRKADLIIIPGTKSTIADLCELRRNGAASAIVRAHRQGSATVVGICGGYQMMGQTVEDPDQVEGDTPVVPGLGLLPVSTRITPVKTTRTVCFRFQGSDEVCKGYEIHMGQTLRVENEKLGAHDGGPIIDSPTTRPLNLMTDGTTDGCLASARCMGTYIHGILDNPSVIDSLLAPYLKDKEKAEAMSMDYKAYKEEQYDKLAAHVREHVDLPLIYQILTSDHD